MAIHRVLALAWSLSSVKPYVQLDLDELERLEHLRPHEIRAMDLTGYMVIPRLQFDAVIQRLQEAEAEVEKVRQTWAVTDTAWKIEANRLRDRIAQLERVRETAEALVDSGELGHWVSKPIPTHWRGNASVRVEGNRALDLGAALAALKQWP